MLQDYLINMQKKEENKKGIGNIGCYFNPIIIGIAVIGFALLSNNTTNNINQLGSNSSSLTVKKNALAFNPSQKYSDFLLVDLEDKKNIIAVADGYTNVIVSSQISAIESDLIFNDSIKQSITCDINNDKVNEIFFLKNDKTLRTFVKNTDKYIELNKITEASDDISCIDFGSDGVYELVGTNKNKLSKIILKDNKVSLQEIHSFSFNIKSIQASIGTNSKYQYFIIDENNSLKIFQNLVDVTSEFGAFKNVNYINLADLNNDGNNDLIIVEDNKLKLYYQNSVNKFEPQDFEIEDISLGSIEIEDFDNNGFLDIYINNNNGANKLFLNNNSEFKESELGTLDEAQANGINTISFDLDENGILELYIAHNGEQRLPITVYELNNKNNWIKIENSNYGSLAIIYTEGKKFVRNLDKSLKHIGLGTLTQIDKIEIIQSNGELKKFENPEIRKTLTVD